MGPSILLIMVMTALLFAQPVTADYVYPPTGSPSEYGNCRSGNYSFSSMSRIYPTYGNESTPSGIDYTLYDAFSFTGINNTYIKDNKVTIHTDSKTPSVKLAFAQWLRYAKITFKATASTASGVITAMSLVSAEQDEIDAVEIQGKTPYDQNINMFSTRYQVHMLRHVTTVNTSNDSPNIYEVDWRNDSISFKRNSQLLTSLNESSISKDAVWPKNPALLEFTLWSQNETWSGYLNYTANPTPNMTVHWVNVECYDNNMKSVSAFPPITTTKTTSSTKATTKSSSTKATNTPSSTKATTTPSSTKAAATSSSTKAATTSSSTKAATTASSTKAATTSSSTKAATTSSSAKATTTSSSTKAATTSSSTSVKASSSSSTTNVSAGTIGSTTSSSTTQTSSGSNVSGTVSLNLVDKQLSLNTVNTTTSTSSKLSGSSTTTSGSKVTAYALPTYSSSLTARIASSTYGAHSSSRRSGTPTPTVTQAEAAISSGAGPLSGDIKIATVVLGYLLAAAAILL